LRIDLRERALSGSDRLLTLDRLDVEADRIGRDAPQRLSSRREAAIE
jgi:hypothetical protein